jgi:hypothetical protein
VTNVSIYVAAITGATGLLAASVPQLVNAYRESRQSRRDRQDRETAGRQEAYLKLLAAAAQLRTQVANYYEHKGAGLRDRLAEVRKLAADTEQNAVRVQLLAPGFSKLAGDLATAATGLAERTVKDTDRSLDAVKSDTEPDYQQLDHCALGFREAVTAVTEVAQVAQQS